MSELPVDEMAPYAPQYDAIVTKYWWEVQLVLVHQPRQYQQRRCQECCVPGPPTSLALQELMKQDALFISKEDESILRLLTRSHGALTLSVWLRIHSCHNQEGSYKPSWDSSTKGIYMHYAVWLRPSKSYRGGWWCVVVGGAHKILVISPEAKFLFSFKPSKCLLSISLIKIKRCSP